MTYNRKVQSVAAIVLIVSLLISSTLVVPRVDEFRVEAQKSDLIRIGEAQALPPQSVLTAVLLSIFRGLAVDFLWYRANALKEEGKLFEANQHAQWITELQPRFPQVWAFHAWNMAYNISVMTKTPIERWDWVNKGISLLRKGIKYNPRATRLYRELGWIFFHKIGQYSDDMHGYYKVRLADEWQQVLGGQRDGMTTAEVAADFKKVVDAADTLPQLIKDNPGMDKLIARINEGEFNPPNSKPYKIGTPESNNLFLRRVGWVLSLTGASDAPIYGFSIARFEPHDRKIAGLFSDPQTQNLMPPLLAYLRKNVLNEIYFMQPAFMHKLMVPIDDGGYGLGPVDWRHPSTHAMYWDMLGVTVAPFEKGDDPDIDLLNTYRGVIHGAQLMMQSGRISFDALSQRLDLLPDPRFIKSYENAYLKAIEHLKKVGRRDGATASFEAGYENFLLQSVVFSYLYGDQQEAQEYYDKVRRLFGKNPESTRVREGRYLQTLEELVYTELTENMDMQSYSRQAIDAFITQGISTGLAVNRPETFTKLVGMAKRVHEEYQKKSGYDTVISSVNRMAFPPFPEMLSNNFIEYFKLPANDPLLKARVWRNTPLQIRLTAYDRLLPTITRQMIDAGLNPELAFPAPEGIEAWRIANPGRQGEAPESQLQQRGTGGVVIERQ
jgi:tetratricopeptide (TPR) repeat protein